MGKYKLTAYERETNILFNESDSTATVFTYNRKLQNDLNELVGKNPDIIVASSDEEYIKYIIPKSWVRIKPPRKRDMTEEQRAAAAERLANARKKKGQ